MAQKGVTTWSLSTSADVVARRCGGRRRINAARRRLALERQRALLLLAQAEGWPLTGRGGQARYARALGVSRATVCRDVHVVLDWMRQGPRPCPLCGSAASGPGELVQPPIASAPGDLAERVRQELALVRRQLGLDGSPASATPATLPPSRVMVTRCG